jgi:hypothetical protein
MPLYHEDSYRRGRAGIFGSGNGHYDHSSWAAGREDRLDSYKTGAGFSSNTSNNTGGGYSTPAAGGGTGLLFVVAIIFAVNYRDEILIAFGGLAASAIVFKLCSICLDRKIVPFLAAIAGLGLTCLGEYSYATSGLTSGIITDDVLHILQNYLKLPIVSNHIDLFVTASIGIAAAFVGFFYASSKKDLVAMPAGVLVLTAITIGGISLYQFISSSPLTTSVQSADRPTPPAMVREKLAARETEQKIPATGPERVALVTQFPAPQSQTPKYATVNTDTDPLRVRSCPVSCPVIAKLPKGEIVKIIGAGANGWPEIEASTAEGSPVLRGFADGKLLKVGAEP